MYVETDFLLALAKDDDWLQGMAVEFLDGKSLETSLVALMEFLVVSDRFEFDRTRAMADLLDVVSVDEETRQIALKAAIYQDEKGATAFDTAHAGIAETRGVPVLGSDQVYDEIGIERVPLERDEPD